MNRSIVSLLLAVCLMAMVFMPVFAGMRVVVPDTATKQISLPASEVRAIITALNATYFMTKVTVDNFTGDSMIDTSRAAGQYNGSLVKVRDIIDAVTSGEADKIKAIDLQLTELSVLIKENQDELYVLVQSWPSPKGIVISILAMSTQTNENGSLKMSSADANFVIPMDIANDPDVDLTTDELNNLYGWNTMRDCENNTAQQSAVFFKMIEEGQNPYIITVNSVHTTVITASTENNDTTVTSECRSILSGQCFGFNNDQGVGLVNRAADILGDGNGIATPWEIEQLSQSLPAIHLASKSSKWLGLANKPLPDCYKDINIRKARQAYAIIRKAPSLCDEILLR